MLMFVTLLHLIAHCIDFYLALYMQRFASYEVSSAEKLVASHLLAHWHDVLYIPVNHLDITLITCSV